MSFCARSGKQRYSSTNEAYRSVQIKKGPKKLRVYRCPDCDGYHVTHAPQGPQAKRRDHHG